jgi:L-ascorbate metabolism protein UlaG (beta-lactamase superfamily)
MKLTKYQHACLQLEKEGTTLIVDPGVFSHDFIMPHHVDGVIITHEHPDHFDESLVTRILTQYPKAMLIAPENITSRYSDYETIPMAIGQVYTVGTFTLRFFGGEHAAIAPGITVPTNFGVLLDDSFYYPGDAFVAPEIAQIDTLALPVSAPWLKISDTIEFLQRVSPRLAFPTHDAILSADGKSIVDKTIGAAAGDAGIIYKRLDGSSVDS